MSDACHIFRSASPGTRDSSLMGVALRDKARGPRDSVIGSPPSSVPLWLSCCFGLGAFAFAVHGAAADGISIPQGSAFNRTGLDPTLERDSRGMSQLAPEPSRTPGGRLYEPPYEIRPALPFAGSWDYRLSLELGAIHDSGKAPRIRDYGDFRDGALLNYFNFGTEQAATARYFDVTAGAIGREDQHYRATFGRYGDFRTGVYFSQVPKLFTDQARTVFLGAGSGSLTPPAGLVPGGN